MLHRNKSPMMSMKVNGSGWWKIRTRKPLRVLQRVRFLRRRALEAKPVLKGIITFPEFTPDLDWYTYVFKVTDF